MKTSQTFRTVVQIDEVDIANQEVHVIDKTGHGTFRVSYTATPGASFSIPKQGENWVIIRNDYEWSLDHRFETGEENVSLQDMEAGDTRVHAASTLHLDAAKTTINGSPFGVTTWEKFSLAAPDLYDTFDDGFGSTNRYYFTLSHEPTHSQSVQVFAVIGLGGDLSGKDPSYHMDLQGKRLILPAYVSPDAYLIIYYQYIP